MSRTAKKIAVALFLSFLGVFFALHLILPDRSFSEQENRYLQTFPAFSARRFFAGSFESDFETYTAEQFPLRDGWIRLKARLELIQGKAQNNGIYLCEGERLIEPYTAPSDDFRAAQTEAVNALVRNTELPVTLALIPDAAELFSDLLPQGVPNDSQREVIDKVFEVSDTQTVDLCEALSAAEREDLFYRTDHHWTSYGAFLAYQKLSESLSYAPLPRSDFNAETVTEEFYGTAYSSSGFGWVEPDRIETYVDEPDTVSVEKYEGASPTVTTLYDKERLSTKDKYSFFLGGNTPRAVIKTGHDGLPVLLMLRDSYSDSLVPFLLAHYSEIHLLDLRYYRDSVAAYAKEQNVDEILVLYSVRNFSEENSIALIAK